MNEQIRAAAERCNEAEMIRRGSPTHKFLGGSLSLDNGYLDADVSIVVDGGSAIEIERCTVHPQVPTASDFSCQCLSHLPLVAVRVHGCCFAIGLSSFCMLCLPRCAAADHTAADVCCCC